MHGVISSGQACHAMIEPPSAMRPSGAQPSWSGLELGLGIAFGLGLGFGLRFGFELGVGLGLGLADLTGGGVALQVLDETEQPRRLARVRVKVRARARGP